MREFCITTDSNSDLPQKYIDQYNTTIIPQYYSFGDTVYGDELNMSPAEFYDKMKNGELPQSQANNPAVIEEKFRAILDEGKDIIHIAFSSALSGSYNNVCMVDDCAGVNVLSGDKAIPVKYTLSYVSGQYVFIKEADNTSVDTSKTYAKPAA